MLEQCGGWTSGAKLLLSYRLDWTWFHSILEDTKTVFLGIQSWELLVRIPEPRSVKGVEPKVDFLASVREWNIN